ncbi:hypothetical protein VNI00_006424 [Paramarasmius palmivorus]|uniref:F-box domain-containing protein n=1 Tax=Paramarasmius palmivorus TaxID=297713 RepID=A0AAW0D8U5_9AGAR
MSQEFRNRIRRQLFHSAIQATREDPLELLQRVFRHMRANDPFIPPENRCPIDSLPNELLSYIFSLASRLEVPEKNPRAKKRLQSFVENLSRLEGCVKSMTMNGSIEALEEECGPVERVEVEEDPLLKLPFQVAISHVCRRWRDVCTEIPSLWTLIALNPSMDTTYEAAWVQRSKDLPLNISLVWMTEEDLQAALSSDDSFEILMENGDVMDGQMHNDAANWSDSEEDEGVPESGDEPWNSYRMNDDRIKDYMGIIQPHVHRWSAFTFASNIPQRLDTMLVSLSEYESAPLLERLSLVRVTSDNHILPDQSDQINAYLPFKGNLPRLDSFTVGGIGLDWDTSLTTPMWNNLRKLTLASPASRPSLQTFATIISSAQSLDTITFFFRGPELELDTPEIEIRSDSIKTLRFRVQEPLYIAKLFSMFRCPSLDTLDVHFDEDDGEYTDFISILMRTLSGMRDSTLVNLRQFYLHGLPCWLEEYPRNMAGQLINLRVLYVEADKWLDLLTDCSESDQPSESAEYTVQYCRSLEVLYMWGNIDGDRLKHLVRVRKDGGAPLKKVMLCSRYPGHGIVDEEQEQWLKKNLETFGFFERAIDFLGDPQDLETLGATPEVDEDPQEFDPDFWRRLLLDRNGALHAARADRTE